MATKTKPYIPLATGSKYIDLAYERASKDHAQGHHRGLYFDEDEATRAVAFFGLLYHYKGEWAGQPLILEPWQEFCIREVFGWKRADGTRRFRKAYQEVPRKNGKTLVAAGVGLKLLAADNEAGAEIYSSATKKDQSKLVFDDATKMAKASGVVAPWLDFWTTSIVCPRLGSKFQPLSSEYHSLDGLNTHGNIIDELHAHKTRELFDVLDTSMGARRQPLTYEITTAGVYRPESIGWTEHRHAQQVLEGTLEDDETFAFIASAEVTDDWADPDTWTKANPNLGISPKLEYMRGQARKAAFTPSFLDSFLRYHLNIWTAAQSRWLSPSDWEKCGDKADPNDLLGQVCFGGLDLASVNDLAAFVLVFPDGGMNDTCDVLCWFWCPEDNIARKSHEDQVPYISWQRRGYIKSTPGNVIDYDVIEQDIIEICKQYKVREIGFDRWGSASVVTTLQNAAIEVVELGQGYATMSMPTKELERRILGGMIAHGNNPVLTWMAANTSVTKDPADNIKPAKDKSIDRIDGITALVMAIERWIAYNDGIITYPSGGLATT